LTALVFLLVCPSCAYLDMMSRRARLQSQFDQDPSQKLAVRIAPEGVFAVEGTVPPSARDRPILITAIVRGTNEPIGGHVVVPTFGRYWLYLPTGTYDVLAFADLDGDGTFSANELVGRSNVDAPVVVDAAHVREDYIVPGPYLPIDRRNPTNAGIPFSADLRQETSVRASLDDEFFDPKYGQLGLYDPVALFVHNQGFVFGLEPFDSTKVQVLFVHGVSGTPRDFAYLVDGLDRTRFQPWFFYWPTGMPIDRIGQMLARVIDLAAHDPQVRSKKFVVVSHSVGGLVAESALRRVGDTDSAALKGYVSFAAAYGGSDAARKGVNSAPLVVPSWRDIATDSDFLVSLTSRPFPKSVPFYLFFAWGTVQTNGPAPAGDGTISLRSQLDPRMQIVASQMYGVGESHVGILNNDAVRSQFVQILNAMAAH
jgi:pimeloyl-ACP methyl ester carboxylesterase